MSSLNSYANSIRIRMAPLNVNSAGLAVPVINPEQALTRVVLASMLWEDQFYVDGIKSGDIVRSLVPKCDPVFVSILAVKARTEFKLRHIPLLLVRELARTGVLSHKVVDMVIQRPDEMAELLAIYWADGKTAISNQLKKGLALSFAKFSEYQLAKWDKNSAIISLRDIMFLVHPVPTSPEQEDLFKRVANNELKTPDTWEVALSGGADKREAFMRLMLERKLGALAFIRNLRNMKESGINEAIIRSYSTTVDVSMVLPFRFLAAARIVPEYEDMLEAMLLRACESIPKIAGLTAVLVDVSGSMFGRKVSAKSDLDRFDAAAALAIILREVCSDVCFYTFSEHTVRVPPRRGFALVEALRDSQDHAGTELRQAVSYADSDNDYGRMIVVTDEQSSTRPDTCKGLGYILNVGAYQNGINQDAWTTITGFSESVLKYIQAVEAQ